MQSSRKAVSSFIHSLENGYDTSYGTLFCEGFTNYLYLGVWCSGGNLLGFKKVHEILSNYFGADYEHSEPLPDDLGFKDGMISHFKRAF